MTGRNRVAQRSDVVRIFLQRQDQFEPLTAHEVANKLDVSRKTAYNRLQELTEEGYLQSKKTGAKGRVWWPESDVWYPNLSELELKNRSAEQILQRLDQSAALTESKDLPPIVHREIQQLDIPGKDELAAQRRMAIREAYKTLAELGKADRKEILQQMEFEPAEIGYKDADSFWRNLIVKHDIMRQLTGVIVPVEGGRYYQYVGQED